MPSPVRLEVIVHESPWYSWDKRMKSYILHPDSSRIKLSLSPIRRSKMERTCRRGNDRLNWGVKLRSQLSTLSGFSDCQQKKRNEETRSLLQLSNGQCSRRTLRRDPPAVIAPPFNCLLSDRREINTIPSKSGFISDEQRILKKTTKKLN